jgi:hypothetical protein
MPSVKKRFAGKHPSPQAVAMLSPQQIERYRAMTPGERLAISLQMTRESIPYLNSGTPEEVRRKHELLRRENESHALALARGLMAAEAYMRENAGKIAVPSREPEGPQ